MNPIDRLVGWFSPNTGLKRARARVALRAYEGASQRDGWKPRRAGASANADHRADAATLRTRARALVQNVPYCARALVALSSNTIGTGITPRATGRDADKLNEVWKLWAKQADADGIFDIYGMMAAAYRAMEQDGEVLVRRRTRRLDDGLLVPIQYQLLEIDWLDSTKQGRFNNNEIINGKEYDALGRVAAYWLFDAHPGEQTSLRRAGSKRIAAEQIIHLYNPDRPGQGRGITRFASVITRVRDLTLYEDAEAHRKNLECRLSVLASGDISTLAVGSAYGGEADPAHARQTGELGQLGSGNIIELPAGVNVTVVEPKPAPGYADYVTGQLHLIAAGLGVPYESISGDMSQVNFSSARVRISEFRRECEQMQWLVIVPRLLEPIWRDFVNHAVLAGHIRRPDYAVEWSTPKWEYVNPEQDVKADLAAIAGGLASPQELIRRRGYNPEEVQREWSAWFSGLREAGMLDVLLALQKAPPLPANGQQATPASET